jgi:signal peptidase I
MVMVGDIGIRWLVTILLCPVIAKKSLTIDALHINSNFTTHKPLMNQSTSSPDQPVTSNQPVEEQKKYSWDDTIRTVLVAIVLAVIFRSFLFEPFHIPSGSMKSNLLVGDYLFVSKYTYGYSRYSFPFGLPIFEGRVAEVNKPHRGDVVVFRLPINPRIDYIKRVMGLPGDSIQVKEGIVYINGKALERKREADYEDPETGKTVRRYAETLPEGKVIHILKERLSGPADDTQIYVVPQGYYFMMGDNRDNSRDSRFLEEVGYVPEENLVGRAEMIFFSVDGTAHLINPFSWVAATRFSRFFKSID